MNVSDASLDAPARQCANCAAVMDGHQDWCLECGIAAPGRLGGLRPGWRAVTTTLALTLVLVGGAGAASYAALSSDANREAMAAAPGDGTPVAQAPPAVPAIVAPVVPAAPVAPPVTTPAPKLPVAPPVTPIAPPDTRTLAQVTPTTPAATPPAPAKPKASTTTRSDDTAAGSRGEGTSADGETSAAVAKLEPIALGAGAVSLYDPYERAVTPGDPAESRDGDTQTTYEIGAPDDGKELQVGLVVDLGAVKQVRGVEFTTTTPGGRVEVYATDGSALPPDILDTRWDHPASRADVDGTTRAGNKAGDGIERIAFPKGGAKYRYVTLWFTTPPEGTTRVGITELELLG